MIAIQSLCVFAGANFGTKPEYRAAAESLGQILATSNIRCIYGAGNVGLMGALADTCLAHGGQVVGVIPHALVQHEVAHQGLTQLHIVNTMHERKAMMADLSDAFMALPGGLGTFEELFEVWTWSQLGIHTKPLGLLNVAGYYDPLIAMVEHGVQEGFLRQQHRESLIVDTHPERLLARLSDFTSTFSAKWLERDER